MEPTPKAKAIEDLLEEQSGRTFAITTLHCVEAPIGCGRQMTIEEIELWHSGDIREYRISGMCNQCQKKVWG